MVEDNKYKESDLLMRSILENAQEEVPEGIWDAISEDLDKASRKKTVVDSLVNSLDSLGVSSLSGSLVTRLQSSVVLLQGGLQHGLVSLVLLVSNLGRNDILLRGLDICHWLVSPFFGIFIQLHIIAWFSIKIKPQNKIFL